MKMKVMNQVVLLLEIGVISRKKKIVWYYAYFNFFFKFFFSNLGCGAFGGDPQLKTLIQLMAAAENGNFTGEIMEFFWYFHILIIFFFQI